MSFCFCPAKLHIFGQIIKWALCNAHSIKPKGMGARAARFFDSLRMTAPAPAFGLYLLVLSVLHLHHLPGLNRPRDLSPNRSQRLADLRSNILHILRLEVPRKCGQNGLAGGGRCQNPAGTRRGISHRVTGILPGFVFGLVEVLYVVDNAFQMQRRDGDSSFLTQQEVHVG